VTEREALKRIDNLLSGDRFTVNQQNAFEHFTKANAVLVEVRSVARAALGVAEASEAAMRAIDLGQQLDAALDVYLHTIDGGQERGNAEAALRNMLWDNKSGIIARLLSGRIAQAPLDRDKLWHIIAKQIACEEACQAWPNGCGCARNAADAVLGLSSTVREVPEAEYVKKVVKALRAGHPYSGIVDEVETAAANLIETLYLAALPALSLSQSSTMRESESE
jgi:hypothetical protein